MLSNTENLTFLSYEEFCMIYNFRPNHLHFLGVVNAITKFLKSSIHFDKTVDRPFIPINIRSVIKCTKGTRPMYNVLKINTAVPGCIKNGQAYVPIFVRVIGNISLKCHLPLLKTQLYNGCSTE